MQAWVLNHEDILVGGLEGIAIVARGQQIIAVHQMRRAASRISNARTPRPPLGLFLTDLKSRDYALFEPKRKFVSIISSFCRVSPQRPYWL